MVLGLPRAQDRRHREGRGDHRDLRRVRFSEQDAHDHESEHVERAHEDEEAQRIEDRREDHGQEEDEGEGTARATVAGHRARNEDDHKDAPGEEEGVCGTTADQALDRQQLDHHGADDPAQEHGRDQPPVGLVPGGRGIRQAGSAGRIGEKDARLHHLMAKVLVRSLDRPCRVRCPHANRIGSGGGIP